MYRDQKLLFRELEESTSTGCWYFDLITEKLTWSDYTYKIHAVENGHDINTTEALNFYHEDDREKFLEAFDDCANKGRSFRLKLRIRNSIGDIVHVVTTGRPIRENERIVSVMGTLKDVSAEAKLFERSRAAEEKYTNLTALINDYFIVAETDKFGKITYANDQFCEVSKYSPGELAGKDHRILNSGTHDKTFFRDMWKTIKAGSAWEGLICNRAKDGSIYWVRTFIFPKFRQQEIIGFMAIRLDVTDDIEAQKELEEERKRNEFSAQLAAVGEMSAGIAHEINNPLTVVIGKLSIMKRSTHDEEKMNRFIGDIERSALRIAKIVKGLHYLSQKSRSDEHSVVELGEMLNYTFEFCREALKSKDIDISLQKDSERLFIRCDEVKISQVFLNLINNARDAITDSNAEEKWIKLVINKEGRYVRIDVMDSGPGIPEEIRDKILEPFFTTKDIGKGTGLGLSIVARFLIEHDGTLEIIENDYLGKSFRVTLPLVEK
ncbi:MAG: hypothetical protein CME65_03460 [Halobacteriovoraceae bacterium]|nr:hypothetical protein [Halobacteriovoraceae bacterium]|tara:strand:+ start:7911 stop:9389 length:1479 start_codon:yes stop_codon:yes gene_type:complete